MIEMREQQKRELNRLIKLERWALTSESAPRVRAMIELAKSEAGVPVLPADLDTDPMLLNVLNGTVDLRQVGCAPTARRTS